MEVKQHEGFTVIDRRGGEPCRCCGMKHPDAITSYGSRPHANCITALRQHIQEVEAERLMLAKLASKEPQFFNPMDAWNAESVRNRVLKAAGKD